MAFALVYPDDLLREIGEICKRHIVANLRQGRDATGKQLPAGTDLVDSGRLLSDITVRVDGDKILITYEAPYAQHVNKRTPIDDVPPDKRPAMYAEIQAALHKRVTIKEI